MKSPNPSKLRRLKEEGLLHPRPEGVRDSLFHQHPEFFDSHDLLQVRYEALRAHWVDGEKVVGLCLRFGVSRQTFYSLLQKFIEQGSAGLLPGRPGPKGPSKLSVAVMTFARGKYERDPDISGAVLATQIQSKFGLSIHKRTMEKLLGEFRSKKNF